MLNAAVISELKKVYASNHHTKLASLLIHTNDGQGRRSQCMYTVHTTLYSESAVIHATGNQ